MQWARLVCQMEQLVLDDMAGVGCAPWPHGHRWTSSTLAFLGGLPIQ